MDITKQQFEQTLSKIDKLIENNLVDDACSEYIAFKKQIENKNVNVDKYIKAEFYASFAYFLFDVSEYETSLKMLIEAQSYGYSKDQIEKVVWEAFIEPNSNDFKEMYIKNTEFLLSNKFILKAADFEELSFWLIPTLTENEYYIYDKNEKLIKEKICFKNNSDKYGALTIIDNSSDFLVATDWNFNNLQPYLNSIKLKNKKSYIIINDYMKFLSCFQGALIDTEDISDLLLFDGIDDMKGYFRTSNDYLPRNIINLSNKSVEVQKAIDEIHEYRITKEGRRGDNVLISICIPSYNRGKRAYDNIIHNLQCYYDEEIEFILSNNGTKNESKLYYDKIEEIDDSRLKYFAFKENQDFALNLCKVAEIATGKFILLLSDEDLINFNVIHNIINALKCSKETLAIMRTKGDGQAMIPSTKLAIAGSDALFTYMLTSNYMSGIIFNNELLKKHNGIEYVKQNLDNNVCLYYPHMFWELLLCQYGDVEGSDMILINEGKAEGTEIGTGIENKHMPQYATIEGRIKQHEGFLNIFKDLEICKKDFDVFREMYMRLSGKTIFLVSISINVFYKDTDMNLIEILNRAYAVCIKYLDKTYNEFKNMESKQCYLEDVEKIKYYYEYYKNQL